MDTSGRRMASVTSSPFKYIRWRPSAPYWMETAVSGSAASTAAASSGAIPRRFIPQAAVR